MVLLAKAVQQNFGYKISLPIRPVCLGLNNCKTNFNNNKSIQEIIQQLTVNSVLQAKKAVMLF
jgi:hypothetical protein